MKIKVWIKTDKVGSRCEDTFDINDDATDEEIEEAARETAFAMVDWSWEKSK